MFSKIVKHFEKVRKSAVLIYISKDPILPHEKLLVHRHMCIFVVLRTTKVHIYLCRLACKDQPWQRQLCFLPPSQTHTSEYDEEMPQSQPAVEIQIHKQEQQAGDKTGSSPQTY